MPWNPTLLAALASPNVPDYAGRVAQMDLNNAQRDKMLAELAYLPAQQQNEELKTKAWLAQSGYTVDPATGQLVALPAGKNNLDNLYKTLQMQNLLGEIKERNEKGTFQPLGANGNQSPQNVLPNSVPTVSSPLPPDPVQQGAAPQTPLMPDLPNFSLLSNKLNNPASQGLPPLANAIDSGEGGNKLTTNVSTSNTAPVVQKTVPVEDYATKLDMYQNATSGTFNNQPVIQLSNGRVLTQGQYEKELDKVQKEGKYYSSTAEKVKTVVPMIDDAMSYIKNSNFAAGLPGYVFGSTPGSSGQKLEGLLSGIKSNLGFDNLNEMRQSSPTGGALGQISDKEGALLQSTKGSLDRKSGEEQLLKTLERIKNGYLKIGNSLGMDTNNLSGNPVNTSAPAGKVIDYKEFFK